MTSSKVNVDCNSDKIKFKLMCQGNNNFDLLSVTSFSDSETTNYYFFTGWDYNDFNAKD